MAALRRTMAATHFSDLSLFLFISCFHFGGSRAISGSNRREKRQQSRPRLGLHHTSNDGAPFLPFRDSDDLPCCSRVLFPGPEHYQKRRQPRRRLRFSPAAAAPPLSRFLRRWLVLLMLLGYW